MLEVSPAGFEPALPKESDLESDALDHSAIETSRKKKRGIAGIMEFARTK